MQKRRRLLKMIYNALTIFILLISLKSLSVYADKGELKINNQVIYKKSEENQNNTATFTIYQLFLKDMTTQDNQVNEEKIKLITHVNKELFLEKTPKQPLIEKKVTPVLFSQGYVLNDEFDSAHSNIETGSNLLVHLVLILGGLILTSLGILLGRAFPKWLKKE